VTATPGAEAEARRLDEDARRLRDWKRFGPYLAERQWGTVREDYSADGEAWRYFPHDHARSRVYRWGEDGLLGVADRQGRMCFALALWNGQDPILKERLFGLTSTEGNHGEDVKEHYFYLDSTPTHSYMRALYKYPQRAFPYDLLVAENGRRTRADPEYEIGDTGVFDDSLYFDVQIEYAKASPDDLLIAITATNRAPAGTAPAPLVVLPTLWFRNTWVWGREGEGYWAKPRIDADPADPGAVLATHTELGSFRLAADAAPGQAAPPDFLFTDNETNKQRLYGQPNDVPYVKDAFHEFVVDGRADAVGAAGPATKVAACYRVMVPAGGAVTLRLRLTAAAEASSEPFSDFEAVRAARAGEAEAFYSAKIHARAPDHRNVIRQAYAGLLWSKQLYHYDVRAWLEGDPAQPAPPGGRRPPPNPAWAQQ
jgi:hypothetical protein